MAILLGLVSALGWGATDFLARLASRRSGALRTLLAGQAVGLVVLTALAAADRAGLARALDAPPSAWALGAAAGLVNVGATFALFRGLATGALALVSPVTASYGAVTTALAALAGEALGGVTAAGIAVTVLGVATAALPPRAGPGPTRGVGRGGLGWAVLASLGYGLGFWAQGAFAVPRLGTVLPVWLHYAAGLPTVAALAARTGALRPRGPLPPLLGTGLLGALAYAAFAAGLGTGQVAVVTVLSSLATAVTVLLARALLRERLAPHQWAGVAAIVAGIGLIDAGR